jgi:hypothetical protein
MAKAATITKGAISVGRKPQVAPVVEVPTRQVVELEVDHGITITTRHGDVLVDHKAKILSIKAIDRTIETGGRIAMGHDTK